MLRRIPISLRFDDEESNFYYGFIEQKKNDRELSTLILDLLHAYYEDDIIKERLQYYLDGKSPFIHIHNELSRIANEHSRHTVMTKMMGDYTANERKKTIEDEPPMEEVRTEETTSSTESPKLLSESENYEALKKELKEEVKEEFKEELKQDFLRELISQMGLGSLPVNNVVAEKTETVVQPTVKVEEAPKVDVVPKVETASKVDIAPKVETAPKIEITTEIDMGETVEKPAVSVSSSPQISVGAEEQVKKPASFGKLLKSVK